MKNCCLILFIFFAFLAKSQTKQTNIGPIYHKLFEFTNKENYNLYEKVIAPGANNRFKVYCNYDNNYLFDIIFNEIDWSKEFTLNVKLIDLNGQTQYEKVLDKTHLKNLYLTNFDLFSKNLVVRLDLEQHEHLYIGQYNDPLRLVIYCDNQIIFGKENPLELHFKKR
jgi:hypothetical protein